MIEEDNNKNTFIKILVILFISFIIMYISKEKGLYEIKTYNKTVLTKESMLKFESDVEKGLNVSIKDYVSDDYKDYSNIVTKTGSSLNKLVETFMNDNDETVVYARVRPPDPSSIPPKYLITTINVLSKFLVCIISINPLVVPLGSLSE